MLVLGPDMFWVHPSRLLQRIRMGTDLFMRLPSGGWQEGWLKEKKLANRNTGGQIALSASFCLPVSFLQPASFCWPWRGDLNLRLPPKSKLLFLAHPL